MDRDKQIKRMVTEWNANLLYDRENYSSDYSSSIFDISEEEEAQSSFSEEIPLPDIDTEIRADLCLFAGVCCDKKTDNEYVFTFPPITKREKPEEFALQILKADCKFKVNTYAMPISVNMNRLISTIKLDNETHIINFVKECKHHVTCYYIRQEQYEKLQKIVKGIKNCIVHTSFAYTVIVLKLLGLQDKKDNIFMNLSMTLKYNSTEVRPYKVELNWDKKPQLPEKLKQRLKVFTHVFRENDLSVAITALISADETEFSWNRTCERNTSCLTELPSSEEENSLSSFLLKQQKSLKIQKQRRKVQRSEKNKQKISRKPLLEESGDSNVLDGKEGNVKSLRKDTLTPHNEPKLSVDTKTEDEMKVKKQKKISSMFQVKPRQSKSVALESDDSNCLRGKLLSNEADKFVSAPVEDNFAFMKSSSLQPISEEKLSHPINCEQGSSMKKQMKISTMLRGKFNKNKLTTHKDDVTSLLNAPPTALSEKNLSFEAETGDYEVKKNRKLSLMSSPKSSDKSVLITRTGDNSGFTKGELILPESTKDISLCKQVLNRQNKSKVQIMSAHLPRQQRNESPHKMQKNEDSAYSRQPLQPCKRVLPPDAKPGKCKIATNRKFISRNFVEISDDSSSHLIKESSNFMDKSIFSTIRDGCISDEDEETPTMEKKARVKQTKQNLHQGHVKNNSDPFAFSSDNAPVPTVNIRQMLRDRATSTPLHKHQYKAISNVTDFEVSSISADEDSMRLHKLWKKDMYKAKKKRVKERDAQ